MFGLDIDLLDKESILGAAITAAVVIGLAVVTQGASLTVMGFGAGTTAAMAGAVTFGLSYGTSVLSKALSPDMSVSGGDRGYQVTLKGSTLPHQIIYGKTKVAGGIVYQGTTENNKYLHNVIAFSGHEIEGFDSVYINEDKLTLSENGVDVVSPNKYVNKVKVIKRLGTATQEAVTTSDLTTQTTVDTIATGIKVGTLYTILNPANTDFTLVGSPDNQVGTTFVATQNGREPSGSVYDEEDEGTVSFTQIVSVPTPDEWTSNHRLLATAYLYVVLEFDADVFPNGVPQITAIVKGKKVYDPRTRSVSWSDNPALCLRDYITSGKGGDNTTIYNYGIGEDIENVDDDLVTIAANVCDHLSYPVLSGGTRFSLNGAFTTNTTPYDAIRNLSTAMGGLLWYAQGNWRMKPAYYTNPVLHLDEDDLRSGLSIVTRHSRRDNFNVVKGTFRGEESQWQISDFPQVPELGSSSYNDFLGADNGQESVIDLQLPFTDNSIQARRIARITLERNRQQLTVQASFGLRALQVQVGDIVTLTNTRLGFTNKEFEVTTWGFGASSDYDIQITISLREISESVFDDIDDGVVYENDNTTLPSVFDVPEVDVLLGQEYKIVSENISTTLVVNVSSTAAERIDHVEVEYKRSTDTNFSILGTGDLGRFEILNVDTPLANSPAEVTYDVRARAINSFGVKGSFKTVPNHVITADTTGPSAPPTFEKQLSGGTLFFSWTASTDFDLSYYKLHHSSSTTAVFNDGSTQEIINKIARPATSVTYPALSGTFFIEPYDKSGNEGTSASVVVLPSELPSLGLSITQAEDPDFNGVVLGGSSNVAVATGPIPDELRLSSFATADSSGVYLFKGSINGGSAAEYIFPSPSLIRTVRVSTNLETSRHHDNAGFGLVSWDEIPNNWDTWPNNWDDWSREDQPYGDFSTTIYVAATDDDPTGSPTWGNWVLAAGEITGRAFKFKAELSSTSNNVSPSISVLEGIVEY